MACRFGLVAHPGQPTPTWDPLGFSSLLSQGPSGRVLRCVLIHCRVWHYSVPSPPTAARPLQELRRSVYLRDYSELSVRFKACRTVDARGQPGKSVFIEIKADQSIWVIAPDELSVRYSVGRVNSMELRPS